MPALPRVDVERALTHKLEMTLDPGGDHRRYRLVVGGNNIASTFVSTETKHRGLGSNLVSKMAQQLNVSTGFFVALVNCSKNRDEYLAELRRRGEAV